MGTDSGILERDALLDATAAIAAVQHLNTVGNAFSASCNSGAHTTNSGANDVSGAPNTSDPDASDYEPPKRETYSQYEQKVFDRCANLPLDCGVLSDVAERILEPVFVDPIVVEDPATLRFIKYNRAAQQALVTSSICTASGDARGFMLFMGLLKKITKADGLDETTVGRLIQSGANNIKARFLPAAGDAAPSVNR